MIPEDEIRRLTSENRELQKKYETAIGYIREKVDQLLGVMGTAPLKSEELDDKTLIGVDPIGIISNSFAQILKHLNRTNEKLKITSEEINAIFKSAGMGILVIDRDMRVLSYNPMLQELFFADKPGILGQPCYKVICNIDGYIEDCPFRKIFETGEQVQQMKWVVNNRYYNVVGTAVRDELGTITRAVLVYMDITERILGEEALRKSEERYRDLFENANDLIQCIDPDGSFLYVNRAWCETLGYSLEEVQDLTIFDIIHPECSECGSEFKNVVYGEKTGHIEIKFITQTGREIIVEGNINNILEGGRFVGTRGIFRNITEKRKTEERLLTAQKIESLGVLAGGIAHDFNNLMNAVIGNIDLALIYSKPGDEIHQMLVRAEKAALLSKDLTSQLLTFSKGGAPVKKVTSIGELISDSAGFAMRGANVRCEFSLPADLWPVNVDKGQIKQAITNLVTNAVQAMPEGGLVSVSAQNVIVEGPKAQLNKEGAYIKITVKDEGAGISKEHISRIFEPYFTTRQTGSGLGLAATYSIIRAHEGFIEVESSVGAGTAFYIYLPACRGEAESENNIEKNRLPEAGRGKVLFMDDEELVRETAGDMLGYMGYDVAFARDGNEAIQIFEKARGSDSPFDVVIMDLTIPGGMGGKEAVLRLLEIDPGVRAIVSSGYSSDPIMANYRQYGFVGVVAKPYKIKDLGEALKKVISPGE
jgi:PAS domain S-box-containing protein